MQISKYKLLKNIIKCFYDKKYKHKKIKRLYNKLNIYESIVITLMIIFKYMGYKSLFLASFGFVSIILLFAFDKHINYINGIVNSGKGKILSTYTNSNLNKYSKIRYIAIIFNSFYSILFITTIVKANFDIYFNQLVALNSINYIILIYMAYILSSIIVFQSDKYISYYYCIEYKNIDCLKIKKEHMTISGDITICDICCHNNLIGFDKFFLQEIVYLKKMINLHK